MSETVELAAYDSDWPRRFEQEQIILTDVFDPWSYWAAIFGVSIWRFATISAPIVLRGKTSVVQAMMARAMR